jgi:DNA polymerase-3 subunit gamma/tau
MTEAQSPSAPLASDAAPANYRVLARKYRPTDFAGLIGQEAMVRTLTNAIQSGRLAHAFVLTGVRGVGKTTTARIIARALNCTGPDGTGGPTIAPCGLCENCKAISEDRHVDVLEMDAASRTGVNDIREIIEGVRYRPTSARFKIYIIDEVHMLSPQAFNALLKTLEEPPEHVKFIFATTEIRKIPITVLSRCQRFDLRRVEIEVLSRHFSAIAAAENATLEPEALALIARAADGSVRDGLSLLDQAIAHGGGVVSSAQVRDMLNLADRARIFDLAESVLKGDVRATLGQIAEQYAGGADPVVILQDMLELIHWLTRLKLVPDQADSLAASETERVRGLAMSQALSMAQLTRAWQMLLKGVTEARGAPNPLQAMEMALIRLCYAAELPSPAEAIEQWRANPPPKPTGPGPGGPGGSGGLAVSASHAGGGAQGGPAMALRQDSQPHTSIAAQPHTSIAAQPQATIATLPAMPATLQDIHKLAEERREMRLAIEIDANIRLVRLEPGRIECQLRPGTPEDFPGRLRAGLSQWTGRQWQIVVVNAGGAPSLLEQRQATEQQTRETAAGHPLVQAVLNAFPGAAITRVIDLVEEDADGDENGELALPVDDMMSGEDEL